MSNTYFYMRISTEEERGLQKFTRQEPTLRDYAKANNVDYDEHFIFKDDKSGKSFDRENWKKLEKVVNSGDTIVFKDITRFTRECENGLSKYMELMNKGINLVFIDNMTLSTDYIRQLGSVNDNSQNKVVALTLDFIVRLILTVELDRAEQERLTISKRIKDGIQASDKTQGRKKGTLDKLTDELKNDILSYMNDRSIKAIDIMNKHNISRNTLKKYISIIETNK